MKKLLLIFVLALAVSLPAMAEDTWMMAAQKGFPETSTYNYALVHQSGTNGVDFTTLAYSHSNWYDATTVTATRKANMVYQLNNSTIETLGFEAGSTEGKYKMYFRKASSSKYYFAGTNADGYITSAYSATQAKDVEVEFRYGSNGTIHYDNKELQLIDNKFVFAEPTGNAANKVYLFCKRSSYPTYGPGSVTIKMSLKTSGTFTQDFYSGNSISVYNKKATKIYIRSTNSTFDSNISVVADGDQPSGDYETTNATGTTGSVASVTINENATPGVYHFTGYYNYNYSTLSSPVTFTVTVKDNAQLVWIYGGTYGTQTEIDPDGYTVEWTPEKKFFNVAEKDPVTGKLTKLDPRTITLTPSIANGPLVTSTANSDLKNGYGYGFQKTTSVNYPCEITYTATSSLGFPVPDLKLTVTAMKPTFAIKGQNSFGWVKDGSIQVNFSSPNLSVFAGSVSYVTAKLEPAFDVSEIADATQADGNYVKDLAKVAVDKTISSTTSGTVDITGIPCSGLYNLIIRYNGYSSNTRYVDPDHASVIPLNIYPSSEGLKLAIVGYDQNGVQPDNIIFNAPIENDTWTGPKDFEDATAEASAYRFVELQSDNVAGITGYYKAGAATAAVTASSPVSIPEGYGFTSSATHEYINLYGADELSLYVAKNGAIAPVAANITLQKSLPVVTGIEAVTGDDASDAPVEFFNLQGIRVNAPEQGQVYIRRQGHAASKIIFNTSN